MIPMSIARVIHESSSRSNALLEPATGNPSYRPAIATGTLTLVIPPRTSVTVTTTSSGLTVKTAGSILDDGAPSEDTPGMGAVMGAFVDGGDSPARALSPANAGACANARCLEGASTVRRMPGAARRRAISPQQFDASHAFRSLNHAARILKSV